MSIYLLGESLKKNKDLPVSSGAERPSRFQIFIFRDSPYSAKSHPSLRRTLITVAIVDDLSF
jgi:hypothetical protein